MKSKSVKVRTLLTVKALFKCSDAKHRLDAKKINEYLYPYGLDCTPSSLRDTISAMKEFGLDIRTKGIYDNRGFWVETRPLSNDALKQIVFAVSTSPYIPNCVASKILQSLKPFVTVYQEYLLAPIIKSNFKQMDEHLVSAYLTALSAILEQGDLLYYAWKKKYNDETQEIVWAKKRRRYMTPRYIYQTKESIYVIGYCPEIQSVDIIDLKKSNISRSLSKKDRTNIYAYLDTIDPSDYIPKDYEELVYQGPVEFIYNKRFLPDLIEVFGQPDTPPPKKPHHNSIFKISSAKITNQTLAWLLSIPKNEVQIKGPPDFKCAVTSYLFD